MQVLRKLGDPYSDEEIAGAAESMKAQSEEILGRLKAEKVDEAQADREIVALIAYLQKLGSDIHWREAQQ